MAPEGEKPEWFEITESDNAAADIRKVNKKLPAIALLATAAIIGAGAIFANASSNDANAEAVTQSAPQTTSNAQTTPSTTAQPGNPQAPNGVPAPGGVSDPSQGGIQAPGGRGDGDGDHRFGDRPPHPDDGDGHEGRGFGDGDHERD